MVPENIFSQEIVQKLGWTLLHFVWQATAAAVILAILLAGLRKATANVRYIIACSALVLIVLLPLVTIHLVPVSSSLPTAGIEAPPVTAIVPVQPAEEMPLATVLEHQEPLRLESINTAPTTSWKQRTVKRLEPILSYIVTGWLLGVFGFSAWHLGGWAQLQRLRRKLTRPVDASLYAALTQLAGKLGVDRVVEPLESALVQVPTVIGWLHPAILLPAAALTGLSTEQLQALLAHELAHIRRYDYLVNMLQTLVETLGFYHPAVWWVSHKIRIERENCCDDLAVSIAGDRILYARALTSMEEIRAGRSKLAVAANGGNLFARIHRLVGRNSAGCNWAGWIPAMISILLIGIIVVPATLALTNGKPTEYSTQSLPDKMLEERSKAGKLQSVPEEGLATVAIGPEHTSLPKFILGKMIENRNKIENFKCTNEQFISYPTNILKNIPGLNAGRDRLQDEDKKQAYVHQVDHLALDNEGTGRVTMIREEADAKGTWTGSGINKTTTTWDGENSVWYSEKLGRTAATIGGTKQPLEVTKRYAQPWTVFGGEFCNDLTRALEQNEKTNVKKQEDGNYWIEILRPQNTKIIGLIDPSQGYSVILREFYVDGKLDVKQEARFEQVKPGIWFPVRGENSSRISSGTGLRNTMTIKEIKINDPNFYDGLYHVYFADGTYVEDIATGSSYVTISMRRPPLLVGKSLPKLGDLKIDLLPANTAGKMILICFLDIEQRPSRNCLQQLNARSQELNEKGMSIVAVHASKIDENSLDEWRRKHNISFPFGMVQGDEDKVLSAWGVYSLPWLILTDSRHVVVAEGFSLSELNAKIGQIDGD